MKNLIIQNTTLTERPPSVRWFSEAKTLLNIIKNYIQQETAEEFAEILKHNEAFEKLTEGVTLEELIRSANTPELVTSLGEQINKNFSTPEGLQILSSVMNYSDKLNSVKENFVAGNSVIRNEYGIESMTSNLKLIFGTQYKGDLSKINFNTTDIEEILALIASGMEALEDFLIQCLKLKDALKISPSIMKIIQSKENQTSAT